MKIKYTNLYFTIDNGFITNSSINEINNLTLSQKYRIITNPTSLNKCSEYDYDIYEDTAYDIFLYCNIKSFSINK